MTLDEALDSFKLVDTMLRLMSKTEVDEILDIIIHGKRPGNITMMLSDVVRNAEVNIKHIKYLYLLGLTETAEFLCMEYTTDPVHGE